MKTKLSIIAIIIMSMLLVNIAEAQMKSTKVKVDPEFEKFWKEFQNAMCSNDISKIKSLIHNPFYYSEQWSDNGAIEEFSVTAAFEKLTSEKIPNFIKNIQKPKITGFDIESAPFLTVGVSNTIENLENWKPKLPKDLKILGVNIKRGKYFLYFGKINRQFKLVALEKSV